MSEVESIETPAGLCRLRRTNRRTLAISVLPDGIVDLTAPRDARPQDIAARVGKRLRWIVAQRRHFAEPIYTPRMIRFSLNATSTKVDVAHTVKA